MTPVRTHLDHDDLGVVFLLDVDNTLLDGDRIVQDFKAEVLRALGPVDSDRYWAVFDALRRDVEHVDYLGALQKYRRSAMPEGPQGVRLLLLAQYLLDYPYRDRLYAHVAEVLAVLAHWGQTVLLTDGEAVLQPRKLVRSGLWDAVNGRVLIYVHKEQMLDAIERQYPAAHYVMVDDKPALLAAMKAQWRERLTTVFPRQGHYAWDLEVLNALPSADVAVDAIGDLVQLDWPMLLGLTRAAVLQSGPSAQPVGPESTRTPPR